MPLTIRDGTGSGAEAKVTPENQLETHSVTELEIVHASLDGNAYVWTSGTQDIDSTDTMLFIKNTGDIPLNLSTLDVIGSNVACTWTIHIGSDTTTPASVASVVDGVNLNRIFAAKVADAEARIDETAVADGDILMTFHTAATVQARPISLVGIILGKGHYIQINQETESTSGTVTIVGYFEHGD